MRAFLFTLLLLTAIPAVACVNESYTFEEKYQLDTGQSPVEFLRERMRAQPYSEIASSKNRQALRPDLDAEFVSSERDAVREIYSGNYNVAIEKLHALEAAHPGNYSTAANLGTAYELAGDNQNALHWISEGIKRNKDSHQGTEWLHKQILEAKIAMESDPEYLKANHILPFIDERTVWHSRESAHSSAKALHYQLGERMLFVKPTDPVVADLLYSFATIEAKTQMPGPAVELLQLAREYGYHDTVGLEETLASYRKALWAQNLKQWTKVFMYIAGICAFPVLLYFGARFIVGRLDRILVTGESCLHKC